MHSLSVRKLFTVYSILFLLMASSFPLVFARTAGDKSSELANPFLVTRMRNSSFAGYVGTIPSGTITNITAKILVSQITCQPALPNAQITNQVIAIYGGASGASFAIFLTMTCEQGSSIPFFSAQASFSNYTGGTGRSLSMPKNIATNDVLVELILVNHHTNQVTFRINDLTKKDGATFSTIIQGANKVNKALFAIAGSIIVVNFSTLKFSDASIVTYAGKILSISKLSGLTLLTLVNSGGATLARTSTLSTTGDSFRIIYVRSM